MIQCIIYTPRGKKVQLETELLSIGATDGRRGLLPGHMPIVLTIEASRMSTLQKGRRRHFAVGPGVLYLKNDVATILVDSFESQEEIDVERAKAAKERAEGRIAKSKTEGANVDLKRAEVALKKALNRISVSAYQE